MPVNAGPREEGGGQPRQPVEDQERKALNEDNERGGGKYHLYSLEEK